MSSLQGSSEDEQEISNPVTKNKKPTPMNVPISIATYGGEGGIRTHGALANTAVFKLAEPLSNGYHRTESTSN